MWNDFTVERDRQRIFMKHIKDIVTQIIMRHFSWSNPLKKILQQHSTVTANCRVAQNSLQRIMLFTNRNKYSASLLETICSSANCPNREQCWSRGTAAVLILGKICTRNCKFCSVGVGRWATDATEPLRLAKMTKDESQIHGYNQRQ